ncbi:MAG: ribbon-helix-helix protein, CopG family [Chloroflexi bacterium]|nr:ribbon-helix-helix protein, CopG family [Chloroflexota bacterium]
MLTTRSVRLSEEDWAAINTLAKSDGRSASWVIQQAVKEYLRRHAPTGPTPATRTPDPPRP